MSQQITTAFVKQFNSTVMHLSQQKGSRLQDKVRRESQKGKSQFFDRIGSITATKSNTRHADTPLTDTPHSRRRVTTSPYKHADLIDDADKIRTLIDPASNYMKAFMWAFGRAKDQEIIDNADGSAFGGEEGGTTVAHPNSQKYAANDGSASANLNIDALRTASRLFGDADVDESLRLHAAITASMRESLLKTTEVTSSDFNTVKALVQGEVNEYMGFNFQRIQLLNNQSGALSASFTTGAVGSGGGDVNGFRKALFWAEDGLLLSTGTDVKGRISERADKNYSTQVFAEMDIGSTRMEEEKVVVIFCDESK